MSLLADQLVYLEYEKTRLEVAKYPALSRAEISSSILRSASSSAYAVCSVYPTVEACQPINLASSGFGHPVASDMTAVAP